MQCWKNNGDVALNANQLRLNVHCLAALLRRVAIASRAFFRIDINIYYTFHMSSPYPDLNWSHANRSRCRRRVNRINRHCSCTINKPFKPVIWISKRIAEPAVWEHLRIVHSEIESLHVVHLARHARVMMSEISRPMHRLWDAFHWHYHRRRTHTCIAHMPHG